MPKLPRSTSSATSSMASGTIPSRPAKPHPDRLKIMHLFPDRPLRELDLNVVALDRAQAEAAGLLRSAARKVRLSLGDWACLALAQQRGASTLTTDPRQAEVASTIGVTVELIR